MSDPIKRKDTRTGDDERRAKLKDIVYLAEDGMACWEEIEGIFSRIQEIAEELQR